MTSISHKTCAEFCCALVCMGNIIAVSGFIWIIHPYPSGLLHCHWGNHMGNHMIAPVTVKLTWRIPWRIWVKSTFADSSWSCYWILNGWCRKKLYWHFMNIWQPVLISWLIREKVVTDRSNILHICSTMGACFTDMCLILRIWHCGDKYCRKISNIRCTKSEKSSDCRLVLQLPLANPLKPGVKLRMKM